MWCLVNAQTELVEFLVADNFIVRNSSETVKVSIMMPEHTDSSSDYRDDI